MVELTSRRSDLKTVEDQTLQKKKEEEETRELVHLHNSVL